MRRVAWLGLSVLLALGAWAQAGPVEQALAEFAAGLKARGITDKYADMTAFFGQRLDDSAGTKTFSDKTGNCRLSWFDAMLRRPADSVSLANDYTRALHAVAGRPRLAVAGLVDTAAAKLDAPIDLPRPITATPGADSGLAQLTIALLAAKQNFNDALAPLIPAERDELAANLFVQSTGPEAQAPFFADKDKGRRVCDLLEKINRRRLHSAAAALAPLTEAELIPALRRTAAGHKAGERIATPAGVVLIGGPGNDIYKLDELDDVAAVLDPLGDDVYLEGTTSDERPVLALLDLAGNDTYQGEQPGIQGGAVLGVSLLLDVSGDDTYTAHDVAQGACLGGAGLLVDLAGNDRYTARRRVQGSAVCGIGLLLDRAGQDAYRGALLAQGVGGPLGFGLLDDLSGNDTYYAGGLDLDGYDDSPGYNGWSQGMGVGPRGTANGGIGTLLDGAGDDTYEADYFSTGGGYWFALGFLRDFGGNDQYLGATRTAFDGGPRKETRFLRYGIGFGCHYACGYLFDDAGDDSYTGDHACVAFNWDIGVGALVDLGGNDRYAATSYGVATCAQSGLALLFDAAGDDSYSAASTGNAPAKSEYHTDPRAWNFTLLLDAAGKDTYPDPLANGAIAERGWAGGFVVDK